MEQVYSSRKILNTNQRKILLNKLVKQLLSIYIRENDTLKYAATTSLNRHGQNQQAAYRLSHHTYSLSD